MPENNELVDMLRTIIQEELKPVNEKLGAMDDRLTAMDGRITAMDDRLAAMDERITALEAGQQRIEATINDIKATNRRTHKEIFTRLRLYVGGYQAPFSQGGKSGQIICAGQRQNGKSTRAFSFCQPNILKGE